MSKKKKVIILATMFVLLVVTGYLNIVLNGNQTTRTGTDNVVTGNFFTTYRTDRQSTRDQEMAYYDAIIASATSSAEAKASAETKKQALVASMEMELVTEGLIKSKGFEDVVVTNSNSCINVVIKSKELTSSEVAQIVSIVQQQCNANLENIKIIPVE
jgi:stage III sporulation protein AH